MGTSDGTTPHDASPHGTTVDGIRTELGDGVLEIRIDRPDRKNALDLAAVRRFVRTLEDASIDETLRVIHLSAAGSDFCGGSDWVASNADPGVKPRTGSIQRRVPLQYHRIIELLLEIQLPVVCEVRGWAAGLGCQIALASDFTVAAESSQFWFPFARRGFTPDSGSSWLLPRLVGVAKAKELLLLGRPFTGADAAEWGMIHRAVPEDDVAKVTGELVGELAGAATVAVGLAKHCVNRSLAVGLDEAMDFEAQALELASRTSDFKEGLRAFTERREPRFEGR